MIETVTVFKSETGAFQSYFELSKNRLRNNISYDISNKGLFPTLSKYAEQLPTVRNISMKINPITKQEIIRCMDSGSEINPTIEITVDQVNGNVTHHSEHSWDHKALSLDNLLLAVIDNSNTGLYNLSEIEQYEHDISQSSPGYMYRNKEEIQNTDTYRAAVTLTKYSGIARVSFSRWSDGGQKKVCVCQHKVQDFKFGEQSKHLEDDFYCKDCLVNILPKVAAYYGTKEAAKCGRPTLASIELRSASQKAVQDDHVDIPF